MRSALETLLYPIKFGSISIDNKQVLFLNAHYDQSAFELFTPCASLTCYQPFKPFHDALESAGNVVSADVPAEINHYDAACLLIPQNMVEAHYLIVKALRAMKQGGILLCAADNKSGGARLKKLFQKFGLEPAGEESRNKARVVWAVKGALNIEQCDKADQAGRTQTILEGRFKTQPGIFGWNKIDKGSQILSDHLPRDIKGKGADFGCGYGYLSQEILQNCPKIKRLSCIDADHRAVQICAQNLAPYQDKVEMHWHDATTPLPALRNLDFIIMNPPFHEGKKADITIGQDFIKQAYAVLRRGGKLWMVANNHLPYERITEELFFRSEKIYEGQGFKVFCAER